MSSAATANQLQLFAIDASGPRALAAPASEGSVHDVLERLPNGVYSALRTFQHNRFLWLDEHFARTERSMHGLGWSEPLDRDALRRALHATTSAYPLAEARVRFDVLREPFEIQGLRARSFIALSPFVPVPAEFLRDGVHVDFAPHLQRREPEIKKTSFVRERKPFPLGLRERYEHVLVDGEGRMLECSSSNIAFIRGRELVAAGSGVLEGITLMVVHHIARELGLARVDERTHPRDLAGIDEAFLCSSSRGVVPVVAIAGARIGAGSVGATTRQLTEAYYAFADAQARVAWP